MPFLLFQRRTLSITLEDTSLEINSRKLLALAPNQFTLDQWKVDISFREVEGKVVGATFARGAWEGDWIKQVKPE